MLLSHLPIALDCPTLSTVVLGVGEPKVGGVCDLDAVRVRRMDALFHLPLGGQRVSVGVFLSLELLEATFAALVIVGNPPRFLLAPTLILPDALSDGRHRQPPISWIQPRALGLS